MNNDTELAVLFADVVGSTELYEALGDLKARDTVADCINVMRHATEEHSGRVIKTIGDEIMATFPRADDALNAAREMQAAISQGEAVSVEGAPLAIRIGCDFGPVVEEDRDVFGSTVHTANRMTSQAKASQILTTSNIVAHLGPEWRRSVRQIDLAPIKGKRGDVAIFEVVTDSDDLEYRRSPGPGMAAVRSPDRSGADQGQAGRCRDVRGALAVRRHHQHASDH